jgi:iron-sulfur cluster repair protein YtfE (RIC family)
MTNRATASAIAGTPTAETRVADIASDARTRAVLGRLGINHCCGGHLALREAAAAAGVPLDTVLGELEFARRTGSA